jgi:hypothetical protein
MLKIAIVGKARSGKDTVAEYAELKYSMTPFAFGGDLKRGFHETYPHIAKEPKPVRGYQLYGQLMRYVHEDTHWIDRTFEKISYINEIANNYNITGSEAAFNPIITDVRQQNEVDRCVEEGYTIVRINCPDELRLQRMQELGDNVTMEDLNFETETSMDHFDVDYQIDNVGSLNDLYEQFNTIVADIIEEN